MTPLLLFLLLGLTACQSFPAAVRFSQLEDDVMLDVNPRWLRADTPLRVQLRFPRPVVPVTLVGVSLRKGDTGERLPFRGLFVEGGQVDLEFYPQRGKLFAYDSLYTFELDGSVADSAGRTFRHAAPKLRTEKRPFLFRWGSERPEWQEGQPVVRLSVTNLLPEAVPGKAVRFQVVCDQERGAEEQTVYFGSRPTSFAPHEAKVVSLVQVSEHDFQPAAWPGVPFQDCRNAGVRARTERRAQLDFQKGGAGVP